MTLEQQIREAVAAGSQVHVWPEQCGGGYRAVVRGAHGSHHCAQPCSDPIAGLKAALADDDRLRRDAPRAAVAARDPAQFELEDAIAVAADFEGLLG